MRKRIFFVYDFSDSDKKYVLDVVEKEWELLHRVDKKIDLLLVKRRLFNVSDNININQLAEDVDLDINEAVDDIMYPRNNRIAFNSKLSTEDFEILELDCVKDKREEVLEIKEAEYKEKEEMVAYDFQNNYGSVTIMLLSGAFLVSLGVIMTIIFILI